MPVIRSISLLLALALGASAANEPPSPPAERALDYLRELRSERPIWQPNPAILGHATGEKVDAIGRRLDDLHERLQSGEFQIVKERSDDRLAAVLVAQTSDFSPDEIQVHGVALIRRDDQWEPAPMPASFENTGIRYLPGLAETAREFETWMLSEIPRELERLRARERARLDEEIHQAVTRDELFEGPPETIVLDFIRACRRRDLPGALARLGGIEDPPPPGWAETLALLATALRQPEDAPGDWNRLLSPSAVHAVMYAGIDADEATVSLGEFDPALAADRREPWLLRHFTLERNDLGFWRLHLPDSLIEDFNENPDRTRAIDADLHAAVPAAILNVRGPTRFDSAASLASSLFDALDQPSPADFFAHLTLPPDTSPDSATNTLLGFAEIFHPLRSQAGRSFFLDLHESGDEAVVLHGRFNATRPQIPPREIRALRLERAASGWTLVPDPEPDPASDFSPVMSEWIRETAKRDAVDWLEILGLSVHPDRLPARPAPETGPTKEIITRWLDGLSFADPRRLLPTITAFPGEPSLDRIFSYLGQELPVACDFEIVELHSRGRWSAATVRHTPPDGLPPTYLLHPVAATPDGPKVFPEIILYHSDSRARSLLNESALRHLGEKASDEAVKELRHLLEVHTRLIENLPETPHSSAE